MFGAPSWPAVALFVAVAAFVAVMFALGLKDVAAIGALVTTVVMAIMKTKDQAELPPARPPVDTKPDLGGEQ